MAYTDGLSSPNSYVKWGWIYTIGACLQRRVWSSAYHKRIYPNMYIILVGTPGVGKGLVIGEVSAFIKHWKLGDVRYDSIKKMSKELVEISNATMDTDKDNEEKEAYRKEQEKKKETGVSKADVFKPPLYPIAADATTYEALVQAIAKSYRRINYIEIGADGKEKLGIQGHSSLCFSLQELSSLMRKHTNDTVNLLLGLYDCPDDYEYITKNSGEDRVKRGCVNLLAGTTPGFMQSVFDAKLVNEGLSSRTFFIYARKNRKNQFRVPPLTPEQEEYKKQLLEHIKYLSLLFGEVKVEEATWIWLEKWWNDVEENKHKRTNSSLKLVPYYARKNIHVMKVAMALHFGETYDMTIPLSTFQAAIAMLDEEEKFMDLAITIEEDTTRSRCLRKIIDMLTTKPEVSAVEIICACFGPSSTPEIEDCINFLVNTSQIEQCTKDEEPGVFYKLKD